MGKGDRKTAKGKRYNSSYGNARTHVATKATGAASAPVAKKAATRTTRAPAKKVVAKTTVVKASAPAPQASTKSPASAGLFRGAGRPAHTVRRTPAGTPKT